MHEIRPILLLWITLFSGKIGVFGGMCSLMTYIETKLKREIVIDSIITIHYFEYMRDFVFRGESHDFWEFMYVDKGSVIVQGGEHQFTLHAGDIIFHEPNEFHAIRSVGNFSPNLVAVSFVSHSPAMGEFLWKKMTLNMEERTLVSHILDTAPESIIHTDEYSFRGTGQASGGYTDWFPADDSAVSGAFSCHSTSK